MNVYLFELKREWKSAASWTVIILALLAALMAVVYPAYYGSQTDVLEILKNFPPEFAAAFGLVVEDIFSYGGFYAFCFLYLALCGAIMAASLGLSIFAREKRSKCTDFLVTKPLGRGRLFVAKMLSALTFLVAANIVYVVVSLIVYRASGQDTAPIGNALLASCAMFFTQLVFFAVAVFIAVFAKKVRSVSGMAMAIGFGGFILTALQSLLAEDILRYISPYKYFDVAMAFKEGHFETATVITAAAIVILLLCASCRKYLRSDVHAV